MRGTRINVTLPVLNEEAQLATTVRQVAACLDAQERLCWEIVIADNGSMDRTLELARQLESEHRGVRAVHLAEKGRGRALKQVWLESNADVLSYMDVDLSTDLAALPGLIAAVAADGYDLAIGSRLLPGSQVERGWKREVLSRGYNGLVKLMLETRFSDAQCGFKAISRQAAQALLPLVEDTGWFFDTELLVLAEKLGYHIFELSVRWVEDPDSRVRLCSTAVADIKGLLRLRRHLGRSEFQREPRHTMSR